MEDVQLQSWHSVNLYLIKNKFGDLNPPKPHGKVDTLPALEQLLQEGSLAAHEMHPSETLSCKSLRYPVQKESEFLFWNNNKIGLEDIYF